MLGLEETCLWIALAALARAAGPDVLELYRWLRWRPPREPGSSSSAGRGGQRSYK